MKLLIFLSALVILWSGASNGATTESLQQATQKKALKAQIIRSMEESIAWMSRKDVSLAQIQEGFAKKSEALIEQLETWNQENPDRTVDVAAVTQGLTETSNQLNEFRSKTLIILKAKQELEKTKSLDNYVFYFTRSLFDSVSDPLTGELSWTNPMLLWLPLALALDGALLIPQLCITFITGL